jgi:hypothetical protein
VTQQPPSLPPPPDDFSPPPPPGGSGYPLPRPPGGFDQSLSPGDSGYPLPPPPGEFGYSPPSGSPGRPVGINRLAIASLVASLLGLLTFGIATIVGLICGIVALNQIKRTGEGGRGFAQAAIISGVLVILWILLIKIKF